MSNPLNILVVDDEAANRLLLQRFSARLGLQAIMAHNGAEAVDICAAQLPDLILMDIMMPIMDGIQASRKIRQLCRERWLPIIFLSAKKEEADQLEVLEVGDDFLPKPINLRILDAKIKVMARIADMQQRLASYQRDSEREQQFAGQMLDKIIRYQECPDARVTRWIKPAHHLSGDVIAHSRTPQGKLHFLIADSTGHGLAAAICTLPVVDTFFSMTEKGFAIDEIVREINAKLVRLLPAGRFVAAALLGVDEHEIKIWNGGIPFAVFRSASGELIKEWPSMYPPLGMMTEGEFESDMETWRWPQRGHIVISSDGIVEAENSEGEFFGEDKLRSILSTTSTAETFQAVIQTTQSHLGNLDNRDDLSLAMITCEHA